MGRADDDTTDAGSLLGALHHHFRQRPVTGPEGHSFIGSSPRGTRTTPTAPANLTVVDHIDSSVREVIDDTRALNPDAGPLPPELADVYDWYREQTKNAPEADQQRREIRIYRQYLEHAIAMGDTDVIPPHRCPGCGTFGLVWRGADRRAACLNRRCLTRGGLTRTWSLANLAYEHVAVEKTLRDCAT